MKLRMFCVIFLAGCASSTLPPLLSSAPSTQVPVVITQTCVKREEIPDQPATLTLDPDVDADVRQFSEGAFADELKIREHVRKLRGLLIKCATPGPIVPTQPAKVPP